MRTDRERKSIGAERTFDADLVEPAALEAALERVMEAVWERIAARGAAGRTVTLKIKFADFTQITRARSAPTALVTREAVHACALALLRAEHPVPQGVRLLGVTLSGLNSAEPPGPAEDALPF